AGMPVWLKFDSAQPSASFKIRGIGLAAERAVQAGASRLVSSSGGNAGLAVAYAGRQLGVPVLVVVPESTPALMRERIAAEGAEVVVHGAVWDDAHALAVEAAKQGGALIHPFDHPDIWEGHSSLIHEVAAAMPKPGSVVVAVGGGGLLLGVLQGLRDVGWGDIPVLAAETHGAASLAAAMAAGQPVTLTGIETVALTLGAKRVADEALKQSLVGPVTPVQVTDTAAIDAVEAFLDDHRVLVEPACGAALSLVYSGAEALKGPVLVVVCGGAAATRELLASWRMNARD
ncbi:MAG: pyridoxal-phosphate dependent enzyme, partial [Proteobacteria bacterium]|nr:pyridoxal-phosphate dependent enzyme [Pseudomonadota bacterium]